MARLCTQAQLLDYSDRNKGEHEIGTGKFSAHDEVFTRKYAVQKTQYLVKFGLRGVHCPATYAGHPSNGENSKKYQRLWAIQVAPTTRFGRQALYVNLGSRTLDRRSCGVSERLGALYNYPPRLRL